MSGRERTRARWTHVVRVTLREAGEVVGCDVRMRDHVRKKEVADALFETSREIVSPLRRGRRR